MFGILMVGSSYFQVVLESNQEERKREEKLGPRRGMLRWTSPKSQAYALGVMAYKPQPSN